LNRLHLARPAGRLVTKAYASHTVIPRGILMTFSNEFLCSISFCLQQQKVSKICLTRPMLFIQLLTSFGSRVDHKCRHCRPRTELT